MIAEIAVAVLMQAAPTAEGPDPSDWNCAQPLIERNYRHPAKAVELAHRIADECVRPYAPRRWAIEEASPEAGEIFESGDRTLYATRLGIFVLQIEGRILQARRRDAISLVE